MPKISVILTSYNHAAYIAETIKSILNQTFKDFELIILENISDDNSVDIIKSFNDDRIKFIQNPVNMGMVLSVNKGISLAKGKYIAHISSDDIWLPTKLEKQIKYLDENPNCGACFTKVLVINEEGVASKSVQNYQRVFDNASNKNNIEWLKFFFNIGNSLCYPSALVRAECYKNLGAFDARYQIALDVDMWIRICTKYEIQIIDEILTKFRSGSNSTSSSSFSSDIFSYESENIYYQYLDFENSLFSKIFEIDLPNLSRKDKAKILIEKCLEKGGNHINLAFRIFNEVFANPQIEDATYINDFFQKRKTAFKNFKLIKLGSTYKAILFLKNLEKSVKKLRFWLV
ncbi:MAG: glycosyltransferase [Rickettsiales bacterium]|nr:glycosyltransferase [Rickettsiales bacterium]